MKAITFVGVIATGLLMGQAAPTEAQATGVRMSVSSNRVATGQMVTVTASTAGHDPRDPVTSGDLRQEWPWRILYWEDQVVGGTLGHKLVPGSHSCGRHAGAQIESCSFTVPEAAMPG